MATGGEGHDPFAGQPALNQRHVTDAGEKNEKNPINDPCRRPRNGERTARGWRDGSNHDAGIRPPVSTADSAIAPEQIKHIRETSRVSQAVFAALLNTSLSTVQKWETGAKRPTGTALKLLHLVQDRGLEVVA